MSVPVVCPLDKGPSEIYLEKIKATARLVLNLRRLATLLSCFFSSPKVRTSCKQPANLLRDVSITDATRAGT